MAERKRFIDVEIPILGDTIQVLGTPKELDKKTIKLDLSRRMRGRGLNVTFQIFSEEKTLTAFPKKMELVMAYIRRMMRKKVDYVEDSFKAQCKDIRVTIKPMLITRKRVSRVVRKNLRNTTKEFLLEYLKNKDYNEICEELLESTLQKQMLIKLKKVYPLSFCDIRVFETKELEKIDLESAKSNSSEMEEPSNIEKEIQENSNIVDEIKQDSKKLKNTKEETPTNSDKEESKKETLEKK